MMREGEREAGERDVGRGSQGGRERDFLSVSGTEIHRPLGRRSRLLVGSPPQILYLEISSPPGGAALPSITRFPGQSGGNCLGCNVLNVESDFFFTSH